jgi:serine protease
MRATLRLLAALLLGILFVGLSPAQAAEDPLASQQWGLTQIHAPAGWKVSTGSGIKIGIVDSGVNGAQEDLQGKVIASATCVGTGDGDPNKCTPGGEDINGHGTHVAGIAAANTGNGIGVSGVAPDARLIVARVFAPGSNGGEPTADVNDVKAGIEWVVAHGAQIVNLSVGVESSSGTNTCGLVGGCSNPNPLGPAVEQAWTEGALPVIASGNQQLFGGGPGYSNLDAIVVGATGRDDTVAAYSSAIGNAKWGIVAPGGDPANAQDNGRMILSTYASSGCSPPNAPNCYAYLAGTSQAAPHVSGAAALLMARGLSRQEVVDTLLATADPINCTETQCGAGRLNVDRALDATGASNGGNGGGGGGGGGGHTATTRKAGSSGGGTKSTTTAKATTSTTTDPFAFGNGSQSSVPTTFGTIPDQSIVLNTPHDNRDGVPVTVGLVGIVSLGVAALAMSYNLRRTLTTLP